MLSGIGWFFTNIFMSFANLFNALTNPSQWLDWSNNEAVMRFIYYGGSVEFFFVVFTTFLIVTAFGIWRRNFMWGCVRVLEGLANTVGRVFAWAGLIMVLQQIVIVFMQRIFTRAEISIGFGMPVTFDVSWWAEELKLYNALIVTLCATYTFVQGGHVRVDLVYSAVRFRTKKIIDMFGSLVFMMPVAVLTWMYGWFFMWRHLVVPNPSATDALDKLLLKSRALRWNIETIGFSPNGFNAYFLFKVILVMFAGLVFLQSIAFFYRSYLELVEGEESENKYLDKDSLGDDDAALEGAH